MRVFLTGGTGFVGAHSATALLRAGHEVLVLARNPAAVDAYFGQRDDGIPDVVAGCMTDEDAVARGLQDCDAVLHAAAIVGLDAAKGQTTYDTNMRGVELVVGGAQRAGIPNILYVSSAVVVFWPDHESMDEDSPVASSPNPYGRSKIDGEHYVRRLQEAGAPIQITYPTGVIGPEDTGLSEGNRSIQIFIDTITVLTSSGIQYVDVRDVAIAHRTLLERGCPETSAQARYLLAGRYTAWAELADLIEAAAGSRLRRLKVNPRVMRSAGSICDAIKHVFPFEFPLTREAAEYVTRWTPASSAKIERELGIRSRDIEVTLRDTVAWMRAAGHVRPA